MRWKKLENMSIQSVSYTCLHPSIFVEIKIWETNLIFWSNQHFPCHIKRKHVFLTILISFNTKFATSCILLLQQTIVSLSTFVNTIDKSSMVNSLIEINWIKKGIKWIKLGRRFFSEPSSIKEGNLDDNFIRPRETHL